MISAQLAVTGQECEHSPLSVFFFTRRILESTMYLMSAKGEAENRSERDGHSVGHADECQPSSSPALSLKLSSEMCLFWRAFFFQSFPLLRDVFAVRSSLLNHRVFVLLVRSHSPGPVSHDSPIQRGVFSATVLVLECYMVVFITERETQRRAGGTSHTPFSGSFLILL